MTNDDMWFLIKNRTKKFYERIFVPLKLSRKNDLDRTLRTLKNLFSKKRNHSMWTLSFLNDIDETETEIVLHKRKPESFIEEMTNLCYRIEIMDKFKF